MSAKGHDSYACRQWCPTCAQVTDWYVRDDSAAPCCGGCVVRFSAVEEARLVWARLRFQAGALSEWPEAVRTQGRCGGRYGAPSAGGTAEETRGEPC